MATPKCGRPTTLTAALSARICRHLRLAAVSVGVAAEAEGVNRRRAYDWLARGQENPADEPFGSFAADVERAIAQGALRLTRISLAGGKGSSAATWFLERRFRDDYGRVDRLEHTGANGRPITYDRVTLDAKLDSLSIEELRAIARGETVGRITINSEDDAFDQVLKRLPDADLIAMAHGSLMIGRAALAESEALDGGEIV